MDERAIQKKCIDYLRAKGAYVVKVVNAARGGVPDIICCYKGRFYAFEVKKPTGVPTKLQLYNLAQIKDTGGKGGVVTSVLDLEVLIGCD